MDKKGSTEYVQRTKSVDDSSSVSTKINYKSTGWKGAAVLMSKAQIGLAAMDTLGAFWALLSIMVLAITITYGNHFLGAFARRHKGTANPGDMGMIIGGPWAREVFFWCFWLLQALIAASAMLACSIGFNAVSSHVICTVAWTAVAAVVIFALGSLPNRKQIAWLGWIGLVSIISAIIILMAKVGSSSRPPAAPAGDYDKMLKAFNSPTPVAAFLALNDILFAYAASPTLLPILQEMAQPNLYDRAMLTCQGTCTSFYLVTSIVVWYYCGQYIVSPALGSAGATFKIVCYAVALPSLFVAGILYLHTASKTLFTKLTRGTKHFDNKTKLHYVYWYGCTAFCAIFGFVIAEAVPFFGTLLALIGAVFGSILCLLLPAMAWYYDHKDKNRNKRWYFDVSCCVFMVVLGAFLFGSGLYAASESVKEQYSDGTVSSPFSCKDNSS